MLWKITKINQKEAGFGPFLKKNIARLFHFSIYCFYSAVGTMVVAIASYCTDASSNPDLGPYFIDSLEAKEISM